MAGTIPDKSGEADSADRVIVAYLALCISISPDPVSQPAVSSEQLGSQQ